MKIKVILTNSVGRNTHIIYDLVATTPYIAPILKLVVDHSYDENHCKLLQHDHEEVSGKPMNGLNIALDAYA